MRASKKHLLIPVMAILLFLIVLGFGLFRWWTSSEEKTEKLMTEILLSVSLPESATFRDYAIFLHKQMKPGFTVFDVHRVMRGYSRIETAKTVDGYIEYYRYDFPSLSFIVVPPGITIEYDSSWNYRRFISDT